MSQLKFICKTRLEIKVFKYNVEKRAKLTLKVLQIVHCNIFEVSFAICNIMHQRVNQRSILRKIHFRNIYFLTFVDVYEKKSSARP